MPQRHLDRLTSVDAGFLRQEDGSAARMHLGAIAIFAGPAPTEDELLAEIERRLSLTPRFRQRLAVPPIGAGRPLWVDDPTFNIRYHVRRTALPEPGGDEQLLSFASRVLSQRLDRSKPLWELWVVEGLADDRFAILTKTHRALVGDVGGIDIVTALLDLTAEGREPESGDTWTPRRSPTGWELVGLGALDALRGVGTVTAAAADAARHPARTVGDVTARAIGLSQLGLSYLRPAATTPLNTVAGPHRELAVVRADLADLKAAKDMFGGSVNDVVLSVVAGAIGTYLSGRGVDVHKLRVRAGVPVSVHQGSTRPVEDLADDPVTGIHPMAVDLPVAVTDPVARLRQATWEMQRLKRSRQAVAARALTVMEDFAPPTVMAQASRLNVSGRLYTLLVTNVPGPAESVYLLGRRMTEIVPLGFLTREHALSVAVMSYAGAVRFTLLTDSDTLPDVAELGAQLRIALDELAAALEVARDLAPEIAR